METSNDRLRKAREQAGFASAADAARRFHWNLSTYRSHENGQTPVPPKSARTYSAAFGVSGAWLLTGQNPKAVSEIQRKYDDLEPEDQETLLKWADLLLAKKPR